MEKVTRILVEMETIDAINTLLKSGKKIDSIMKKEMMSIDPRLSLAWETAKKEKTTLIAREMERWRYVRIESNSKELFLSPLYSGEKFDAITFVI